MPIIQIHEFADTFTPNLPPEQKQANNDWFAAMALMSSDNGVIESPDGQYPTLTQVDGGWEYEGEPTKQIVTTSMTPFYLYGAVVNKKVKWNKNIFDTLSRSQRKYASNMRNALNKIIKTRTEMKTANFASMFYKDNEDFAGNTMLANEEEQKKAITMLEELLSPYMNNGNH